MARPNARKLITKLRKPLEQWHQEMLDAKLLNNDPIVLAAGLTYRRSNGTWLDGDSSLRRWRMLIDR